MKKIKYLKIFGLFVLILCFFSSIIIKIKITNQKEKEEELKKSINDVIHEEQKQEEIILEGSKIGTLKIPSILVEAPILEGTSSDILKIAIGHFENTSLWNGNIALASHNRGSYAHYFSRIKELKNGEEIIYTNNMGERRYKVIENKIIEETNVEILKSTKENIITLIKVLRHKKSQYPDFNYSSDSLLSSRV